MTWTTAAAVEAALGTPAADGEHLDACVAASNAWCFRRRLASGYIDDPDVAPDDAVELGATMYAVALYKERGTVDSYASFEAFAAATVPPSTYGQVRRLLGVDRPAVDVSPVEAAVTAHRVAAATVDPVP